MPLSLGADLIIVSGVVNKASGFYGILSLLTGAHIGVMSWILHIFSLVAFPLYVYAFYAIKNRNALFFLAFVHIYFIDTLIDIGFTIVFCIKWFAHARNVAKQAAAAASSSVLSAAGTAATKIATSIAEAAIETAVAATETLENTDPTATYDEEFTLITAPASPRHIIERAVEVASQATTVASNQSTSVKRESVVTIILTVVILLIRIYCTFVLIGYARQLVRSKNLRKYNGEPKGSFAARLQQLLLTPFESFWTGFSSSNYSPLINDNRRHHQPDSSIASEATLLGNPDDYFGDDSALDLNDLKYAKKYNSPSSSPSSRLPF